MIQSISELDEWYKTEDPWRYEHTLDDLKRRDMLINEIPKLDFKKVLDVGCGHGFITRELPGKNIFGVDISPKSIEQANKLGKKKGKNIKYVAENLFNLGKTFRKKQFDLIIITGVLYPQYVGKSLNLIYELIDGLLQKNGILITVHISEWMSARFPYFLLKDVYYDYRTFTHNLKLYAK